MKIKNAIKSSPLAILLFFIVVLYGIAYNLPQYLYIFAINNLAQGNFLKFVNWQLLQFLIGILATILLSVNTIIFEKFIQNYLQNLRSKIIKKYYFSNKEDLSQIQNTVFNNLNTVKISGADNLFKLINQVSILVFSIILIYTINFEYLLVIFPLTLAMMYVPKILDKKLNLATKHVSSSNQKFLETISDWLSGLHEIITFNAFEVLSRKIGKSSSELENHNVKKEKLMNLSIFLNGLANALSQFFVLGLGGYLFFTRKISLGAWAAANDFSFAIFSSVLTITNLSNQIRSVRDLNKDINDKMKSESNSMGVEENKEATPVAFTIKDLSYNYKNNEIKYPDISIKEGEKVLLTGPSGVGKTTLFELILGKIKPKTGSITFFDKLENKINPNYRKIAYLPQKAHLFPDNVANNVTMFNEKLDSKVKQAVNVTRLDLSPDFILQADGKNISGGQQQKIVLARDQVHDSSIVLMDEAISAIDSKTVPELLENFIQKDNRTLVMIEHNLSQDMMNLFDRVIRLK